MPGSCHLVFDRLSDVASALASPQLSVAAPGPPIGAAARLQARMARFSDGADHHRRRALIEAALPCAHGVEAAAAAQVDVLLGSRTATFDVMPAARTLPVTVLAAALGVVGADLERVARLTGRLCDALAATPTSTGASPQVDLLAIELEALLEPLAQSDDERVAAVAGVLFQARDATAALIGSALLTVADEPHRDARQVVERTLRGDAPVRCTRRVALADLALGDVAVPSGAAVWLVLAEAGGDTDAVPATFGSGPHGCPGSSLAVALAVGVLRQVMAAGWRPVPGQPVDYEPRPNLRLPHRVMLERR